MVGTHPSLAIVTVEDQPGSTRSTGNTDLPGLARRGIISLLGAGVSAVLNLALIIVVTRTVGRETAGFLFSTTSLFVVLESLCALGTATGIVYFISRVRALGRSSAVPQLLRTALVPVTVCAVAASIGLAAAAPLIAPAMGADGSDLPTLYLRLVAIFLPFAVLHDVLIAATQGYHTMTPTVLLEKIGRPALQVTAVGAAALIGGAWMLPVAWVGPYAVSLALAALALRRLVASPADTTAPGTPGDAPDVRTPDDDAEPVTRREFWSYTAPRGIAAAAQLSLQRLDIILVAAFLGAAPAAVYTAATRFVVLGQLGSQAVALAIQPKLSELIAHNDLTATRTVYRTTTAWVIAVTWPIHLVVAVTAPLLMSIFGSGYADGRPVVVILAGAMLVATGCGMVTMLLLMSGRSRENLLNVVVALVTNVSLNLILIPAWGIVGAAVSWAVAIVLSNLLPLWQVHRALGIDPFGRGSALVAVLAVGCFAVLPGLGWWIGDSAGAVVGVGLGGLVYLAGLHRLRHTLQLDELISSVARKLKPR